MQWMVNATPRPFYPRERHGTNCIGGWVGPRAGLDGCGKSRLHRDSIPGPSKPVASRYTDWAIPAHLCVTNAVFYIAVGSKLWISLQKPSITSNNLGKAQIPFLRTNERWLYQTNSHKCTHILLSQHFINTIRHFNMLQPLKGHLQYIWYILAAWVKKMSHHM
jgi:hypothetical protein